MSCYFEVLSCSFESAIKSDVSQTAYTSKVSEMVMPRLCCSRLPTTGVTGMSVVGSLIPKRKSGRGSAARGEWAIVVIVMLQKGPAVPTFKQVRGRQAASVSARLHAYMHMQMILATLTLKHPR